MNLDRGAMLKQFMGESDISLDRHVRKRILEAGVVVNASTKIYLDTNFWIWLRNAQSEGDESPSARLLAALIAGADRGLLICPLSESAFIELFKQEDPASRLATAVLMNRLSRGYALLEPHMRMANEVSNFFHRKAGKSVYDYNELAWCRVSFVLGLIHPSPEAPIPPDVLLAIQKGVFDEMWGKGLVDIVDGAGSGEMPPIPDFTETVEKMNEGNAAHAHQIKSFQQALKAELDGVAEEFAFAVLETFERLERERGDWPADQRFETNPTATRVATKALRHALEKDADRDRMPSLHIEASLHASVRWDKKRKLEPNDLFDFRHASAALAYCDLFFTEKPLRTMIEQKHIALDRRFKCMVRSTPADALALLIERGLA
jgi:predicted nucleic acid-binding protein